MRDSGDAVEEQGGFFMWPALQVFPPSSWRTRAGFSGSMLRNMSRVTLRPSSGTSLRIHRQICEREISAMAVHFKFPGQSGDKSNGLRRQDFMMQK